MRRFQVFGTLLYLLAMAAVAVLSLRAAEGRLVYTIDDPYIHLAVAENILRGGYGVNLNEFSSPSASILWPFLLAVTLGLGLGDWGPLVMEHSLHVLVSVIIVLGLVDLAKQDRVQTALARTQATLTALPSFKLSLPRGADLSILGCPAS